MSDLPELDSKRVISKLSLKLADTQSQLAQMETMAEQLRDQRDEALAKIPAEKSVVVDE